MFFIQVTAEFATSVTLSFKQFQVFYERKNKSLVYQLNSD
jgi:hypothetical protein